MEALRELSSNNVLGNPIRLAIMLYLLPRERALFRDLLEVLEVTPGNLDSHLKTLEREGYVEVFKIIADRPRTAVKITDRGAEETGKYLKALKKALEEIEG
ncbi:predicted transcription regulator, ArsR family [Thermococcus kodakarensis KOD1]|uniref:Predicted transcription regulator, ArsR family n=1 Tax=Thermococcus kodakarensis (strain ATCC BAA-918 / JCM 12380 / KOD1) TaxID=69014 RepID=Q5JDV3_THEKO|nr:transcriptional regulator [Thermococcus kodakarensis]WCN27734.1 transcriptional regulator [Thermococcus kodakarensis]WCN30027.1 transcriptional regulator [Thermococcus kodakarensis]BAD86015.1 predicted transcription regulator, ArsR family [Thermococcus kodakarensis KOD1]